MPWIPENRTREQATEISDEQMAGSADANEKQRLDMHARAFV